MNKKKILIIASLLIIIPIVLMLTGELYISEISNSISGSWKNSNSISRTSDSNEDISFSTIPVIVVYKNKTVGDIYSENPVKIDISDKDFGPLWIPLYKKYEFKFTINFHESREFKTESSVGKLSLNGEINISFRYKFIGFISEKKATNMIVDKVMNDIFSDIKKNTKQKGKQVWQESLHGILMREINFPSYCFCVFYDLFSAMKSGLQKFFYLFIPMLSLFWWMSLLTEFRQYGEMKRALQNFDTQLVQVYREMIHYKRVPSNTFKN